MLLESGINVIFSLIIKILTMASNYVSPIDFTSISTGITSVSSFMKNVFYFIPYQAFLFCTAVLGVYLTLSFAVAFINFVLRIVK